MTQLTPLAVSHADVLRAIAGGAMLAKEIADKTGRDRSNLNRDLKKLTAEGLLADDLTLTGEGEAIVVALDRAEGAGAAPAPAPGFVYLTHAQIVRDPDNARAEFEPAKIADLAETLFTHGLQQPPVVADVGGGYQLVMGERRWRAWGQLINDRRWPIDHVEACRVEIADARQRMEAALIENLQRVDLNHMEAGLAFETLGKRFHVSNKDMAARIGRSAEYVQQHRRLTALNADDQQRLREGRLSMHDALRALNTPKPADLTPTQMLLLAEIAHKVSRDPLKGDNYYGGRTEVAYDAGSGSLQELVSRRIVNFQARDYELQRATITFGYEARNFDDVLEPVRKKDAAADRALAAFREAANANIRAASGPYVTRWLIGPFPLHPDAEKELAKRKEDKAKATAATKAEKAAKAEATAALDRMVADMQALPRTLRAEALAEALSFQSVRAPVTFDPAAYGNDLKGANGRKIAGLSWECKEPGVVGRLLALALNLVLELGAAAVRAEDAETCDDDTVDEVAA